jgi:hypothetical protein
LPIVDSVVLVKVADSHLFLLTRRRLEEMSYGVGPPTNMIQSPIIILVF